MPRASFSLFSAGGSEQARQGLQQCYQEIYLYSCIGTASWSLGVQPLPDSGQLRRSGRLGASVAETGMAGSLAVALTSVSASSKSAKASAAEAFSPASGSR